MAREEEPHNNDKTRGRQTKQSNQLSLFPFAVLIAITHKKVWDIYVYYHRPDTTESLLTGT